MKHTLLTPTLFLLLFSVMAQAQTIVPLYPKGVPNSKPGTDQESSVTEGGIQRISKVSKPTLSVFLPAKTAQPSGAVVICPGGGYAILAFDHEGLKEARAFQAAGVAAIVLKYRLPDDTIMIDKSIGPLQDAQQAIKIVRQRSKEWNIDPKKVGIMGFSAGGHLASTASTHFNKAQIDNKENISLRPDFSVLVYPVISFDDSIGHLGSRVKLIGENPPADKIEWFSNEKQITKETPPAFLVHAADDKGVLVQNSVRYFENLTKLGIPAAMHIYEKGGHGFGIKNSTSKDDWFAMTLNWMEENGFK